MRKRKTNFKNRPITHRAVHIIYRLKGSIPKVHLEQLGVAYREAIERLETRVKKSDPTYRTKRSEIEATFQQRFDDLLHATEEGPMFLADLAAKQIILASWRQIETLFGIVVYSVTVMSNHVHVVLAAVREDDCIDFKVLMERHKRFTGRQLNALQSTPGRKVWAHKAFDRDVRPGKLGVVLNYVVGNGVVAGLTKDPLNWCGTYLHPMFLDTSAAGLSKAK